MSCLDIIGLNLRASSGQLFCVVASLHIFDYFICSEGVRESTLTHIDNNLTKQEPGW
jgi:hypothetical protein